ncbi:MAG: hypothetical protein QOF32_2575 [Gammaproteobacteria bacterium]|jgi:hypothetical protein|nr:hypothetical protein [Gammaproteobacteria bacterium]
MSEYDSLIFRKQFAAEQSRLDRTHAVEYVKVVLQILIAMSGVSVTASLTVAGALKSITLLIALLPGVACYLFAVAAGMYGAHRFFLAKQKFGLKWEIYALDWSKNDGLMESAIDEQNQGMKYITRGFYGFCLGVTATVGGILYNSVQTTAATAPTVETISRNAPGAAERSFRWNIVAAVSAGTPIAPLKMPLFSVWRIDRESGALEFCAYDPGDAPVADSKPLPKRLACTEPLSTK